MGISAIMHLAPSTTDKKSLKAYNKLWMKYPYFPFTTGCIFTFDDVDLYDMCDCAEPDDYGGPPFYEPGECACFDDINEYKQQETRQAVCIPYCDGFVVCVFVPSAPLEQQIIITKYIYTEYCEGDCCCVSDSRWLKIRDSDDTLYNLAVADPLAVGRMLSHFYGADSIAISNYATHMFNPEKMREHTL